VIRPSRLAVVSAVPALALVAVLSTPAAAQSLAPGGRIVSIGLGGGVTVPVSDAQDAFNNGYNGHGFVRLNLPAFPIQPRIDFTFQKLDIEDVSFIAPDFTGGEQQAMSALAQGQFAILGAGPVRPYLVAGVGWTGLTTTLDGGTTTGTVEDKTTEFTVSAGAGVNIKLGPLSGYVEARLNNIMSDGALISLDSVQLVPVTFGVVF